MKRIFTKSAKLAAFVVSVFVIGQLWWYMWMHHGWIGTPRLLHQLTNPDGEASYNRTLDEMFIISGLVLLLVYFAVRGVISYRKGKRE